MKYTCGTLALFGAGCLLVLFIASAVFGPPPVTTPTGPPLSDGEKIKAQCRYLKVRYQRTPAVEIPIEDAEQIAACRTIGQW